MGSSKMRNPLKPDAVPTLFAHRPTKAKRPSSVQREEKRQRLEVCIHLFHCLVFRLRDSLYRQYLQLLFQGVQFLFFPIFSYFLSTLLFSPIF